MELFGKPFRYWLELEQRMESTYPPSASRLIQEIAELRGKVSFYESRVAEMARMAEGK